jgi:hypothetical protein
VVADWARGATAVEIGNRPSRMAEIVRRKAEGVFMGDETGQISCPAWSVAGSAYAEPGLRARAI